MLKIPTTAIFKEFYPNIKFRGKKRPSIFVLNLKMLWRGEYQTFLQLKVIILAPSCSTISVVFRSRTKHIFFLLLFSLKTTFAKENSKYLQIFMYQIHFPYESKTVGNNSTFLLAVMQNVDSKKNKIYSSQKILQENYRKKTEVYNLSKCWNSMLTEYKKEGKRTWIIKFSDAKT